MFEFNPDCNAPLSPEEKEYLKHVDEGKIEPLTMKEKIHFFNNLFKGHKFDLGGTGGEGIEIKISTRKNRNTGRPAGRPKGQGRGKRHNVIDVPEMSVNDMPESWAALFVTK